MESCDWIIINEIDKVEKSVFGTKESVFKNSGERGVVSERNDMLLSHRVLQVAGAL